LRRPVRTVGVVVIGVLAQDQPQVPLTGNQHPVQALVAGCPPCGFRNLLMTSDLQRHG
jgi:hypothetical protein